MASGVDRLGEDADLLDAFRVANRAVARALRQRLGDQIGPDGPRWRPFQLAFLLLNLPGLSDPKDGHRETVDLLFFPTGGGKTEAYLGLAAVAMVLRRLRHPGDEGLAGAGVSVIMRYTLRLLTLDQLARAAGLVCALELERGKAGGRYGSWPFEIGLWVGKAATPNILGRKGDGRPDSARAKVTAFKKNPDRNPSPIPLENCPWCGREFEPESFDLQPNAEQPNELRIVCANWECDFSGDRPLPVIGVDEPLYRRLPAFLIATVDKFASLPWVGQSGALLGGADRADADGFYGPAEPAQGRRLKGPLPPPDLVIQDELHLIAGPLGTMAGLYETAIEALAVREVDGQVVKPKIVASTATVRGARRTRFRRCSRGRLTQVFPPLGPNRRDTFFARTVPSSETPARRYVGIASQGRNPKVLMRRVLLALMGAAQQAWHEAGGAGNPRNPADPYMTALAYFNSLRELGGARRILEEEVRTTVARYGMRRRVGETRRLFRDRTDFSEPVELTSRVSTDQVAEARRRLECRFDDRRNRVDCALATNMISVGLDIPRLGLMLVLGQPKVHAEYIQATSRVGRSDEGPGLGRDPAQRPQAPRPFALRAVPPLSRDLLPLGRGGQRHAVLAPCPRPRLCGCPRGSGAPPRAGVDTRARGQAHRRHARRPPAAAPRRVRGTGRAAALRGGGRARGTGCGACRIALAARWVEPARRSAPLKAYAREAEARTLQLLEQSLVGRPEWVPHEVIRTKLLATAPRDIEELLRQLEPRADEIAELATRRLRERGEWEARDLEETLRRQRERIVEELDRHESQHAQIALDFDDDERRQLQANMRY